MIPSVKTLETRLNLTHEKALQLRKLLDGRLDPETFKSVVNWVSQCYNRPSRISLIECAANEILETHGVEALFMPGEFRPLYTYCNTGDSYVSTLIRDHAKGRWLVGSWGDIVENDRRFDEN